MNSRKKVQLGNRVIGEGEPVYIIFEGGLTNWGDVNLAKKQVDAAMAAGADCIKFQAQTTEALVSKKVDPYWYRRLKYKELSYDELRELRDYCAIRNIDFLVTAHTDFDLDFLDKELDIPFLKIGSGESMNFEFLKNVGARKKPVVISLGLHLDDEEVRQTIQTLEDAGTTEIVILHCNTVYPTPPAINHLRQITHLQKMFSYPIGYSDHTVGLHIPIASVSLGVCVIEKHISFDTHDKRSFDCPGSVTPETAKDFVQHIRELELALSDPGEKRKEKIKQARQWAAQSIVAKHALTQGHKISHVDLSFKRPGVGLSSDQANMLIGKKLIRAIEADELIEEKDVA